MQLGATQEKLRTAGVETLAVVNTPVERARQYFRYRPTRLLLAADAELTTHRAFGLPNVEVTLREGEAHAAQGPLKATEAELRAMRLNPPGEVLEAKDPSEAMNLPDGRGGFIGPTHVGEQIAVAHGSQLAGHFLIDRAGIVRWAWVEAQGRLADLARFPSEEDLLAATRALLS